MRKKATVVETRDISPSVRQIELAVDEPFAFEAGQWVHVFVPAPCDTRELKRAYSIASAPGDATLTLAVTRVPGGQISPRLHALPVGAQLTVEGPHGFFVRDAPVRVQPQLFVATGTGIAPFRSMLREMVRSGDNTAAVTLLFGCRTLDDVLFADEMTALRLALPRFRLETTLSRPAAGYTGRVGHVQRHAAELARDLGAPHVFVCGLSRMVADVRELCKTELAYDRKRIHSERFD